MAMSGCFAIIANSSGSEGIAVEHSNRVATRAPAADAA
ncbi:hypothetical protein HMPREF9206_1444 [Cutibacterium acnes J139]|nr:hypothetical protein HMPREF9206_1444 [Cutibacterium acnes J139]